MYVYECIRIDIHVYTYVYMWLNESMFPSTSFGEPETLEATLHEAEAQKRHRSIRISGKVHPLGLEIPILGFHLSLLLGDC